MRIMFDSLSLVTFCPRCDGCPDEGRFAHSPGTYNGYESGAPMDFILLFTNDVHAGIGQQPITLSD